MNNNKNLYLLRHAEAENLTPGSMDQQRGLTEFGIWQAEAIGKRMSELAMLPDLILTSTAQRTLQTTEILVATMGLDEDIVLREPRLYNATTRMLMDVIQGIFDEYQSILLVGHNPTISQMVAYLSQHQINIMPTCGMVHISLNVENWRFVTLGSGNFELFEYPQHQEGTY